jgi:pyruvate/2-oxoglutarate dehydrogenase complex dihydrolipoamide acyltransferase (E2) component
MADVKQFKLPDVGEGLTEADIVSWKVKPGDQVTVNQVIVEIETAKSLVELPSPFEGVVTELLVPEGQSVDVGTPIIAVDVSGDSGAGGPGPHGTVPAATTEQHRRPRLRWPALRMRLRLGSRGSRGALHRRLSGRPCWSGTG